MITRRALTFLGGLVFLAGCADDLAGAHNRGRRPPGDEGPHLAVPFFPDRRDQWGPSALAGVLGFWGRPVTPEELRKEIHFPKQPRSVALDLKYAARARGLEAEMGTGDLRLLKAELDAGRPVIVLLNIGARWAPVRSYQVVTGYNEWLGGVYVHFGPTKDFFISYSRFEKKWQNADRWFLRVSEKKPAAEPEPAPLAAAPPECPPTFIAKRRRPTVKCVQYVPIAPARDSSAR